MPADFPHRDEVDRNPRRDAPGTNERPARESDRSGTGEHRERGGREERPATRPPLTEHERRERWPIG